MKKSWAILLCSGQGSRLYATLGQSKQFLSWKGQALWTHSARSLAACPTVRGMVCAFSPEQIEESAKTLATLAEELGIECLACAGGVQRQDSVRLALEALSTWKKPEGSHPVLIHDSARPFLSTQLANQILNACYAAQEQQSSICGFIPGVPVTDTIKILKASENQQGDSTEALHGAPFANNLEIVDQTAPRHMLMAVQTPQVFPFGPLFTAHIAAKNKSGHGSITDDASLMEQAGHQVAILPGDANNRKITTPEDLSMLQSQNLMPCNGFGYDVHAFGGSRPLKLGGITIPGDTTVKAHSDGDVLLHALMDALLGCIGAGDIGQHFPDSDPSLDNVCSALLLDHVLSLTQQAGLRICHVDLTIVAQKPRLSPYCLNIRRNVAHLLCLPEQHVNFKSTTEEHLGFTGQGLGLKAIALVSGMKP